jgi:flagellar assembly protein FliH
MGYDARDSFFASYRLLKFMASIIRTPAIGQNRRKLARRQLDPDIASQAAAAEPVDNAATLNDQKLQALLESARLSVLTQIKTEAESAREIGRQRGLLEGRQAGREEMQQAVALEVTRIQSISRNLDAALETGIRDLEDIALAIAFEAVCKILGNGTISQEQVQAQVRHAAGQLVAQERVRVRLHPADMEILRLAGALNAKLSSGKEIVWLGDKDLELGGCVVETDGGDLDARFDTQLDQFRKTLLEAREKQKTDSK